jgi:hypothetical protein
MLKSAAVFLLAVILCLCVPVTQAQSTWIWNLYSSTTNNSATITWTTAVPSTTQIRYGLTTSYGTVTALNTNLVTTHTATLSTLTPGTVYHLRLLSKDSEPLQLVSMDYTITTQAGPVAVTVSPATGTVVSGGLQQFTATVTNTSNPAVTWSASAGTINASGLFTAPVVAVDQNAVITATSVADNTKSATATFTVKAPIQHAVSLNWQASPSGDVVAYNAYRSLTHGGPYALLASSISGLAFKDLSVQAGTTYYYVLTLIDDHGEESVNSAEVSASVPSP